MLAARTLLGRISYSTTQNILRTAYAIYNPHKSAQFRAPARPQSMMAAPVKGIREYLVDSKRSYVEAIEVGKGREWVVVMGNEAGDLDSLASAIAFGWYKNVVQQDQAVTLVQTSRSDLPLRAENLHALELAGLSEPTQHLLCIDDIPPSTPFPSYRFALVDHNRLQAHFVQNNTDARVEAIIDHHEDEGAHQDTANPRIVEVPTGSSASLVARFLADQCKEHIPKELATLLLCAILVDTNGLKPGGKAEPTDRQAAAYLAPLSSLAASDSFGSSDLHDHPRLQELTATLQAKKSDVSHLGTRDLLRRDYKEYRFSPSWSSENSITVGLSTIPIGLHPWISADPQFWSATEEYMTERSLSVLGLLTSFRDEQKMNKHGKPKHRREQLYVVREGDVDELADRLFKGLRHAEELDLKKRSLTDDYHTAVPSHFSQAYRVKAWEQGNTDATRKVTAPLVKRIIED